MLSHVIRCHSYLRNSYADQEALENELSKIHNRQFFHYDQKVDQMVEQLKGKLQNHSPRYARRMRYAKVLIMLKTRSERIF